MTFERVLANTPIQKLLGAGLLQRSQHLPSKPSILYAYTTPPTRSEEGRGGRVSVGAAFQPNQDNASFRFREKRTGRERQSQSLHTLWKHPCGHTGTSTQTHTVWERELGIIHFEITESNFPMFSADILNVVIDI